MKLPCVVLVASLLAGCGSTGVRVTEQNLEAFKVGETTEAEVISQLGKPTMRTRLPDGAVMVVYSYAEYSTRPATFIPFVGPFVGGADVTSDAVTLMFGANGKLTQTSTSSTAYGTGRGPSSTAPAQVETSQPRK